MYVESDVFVNATLGPHSTALHALLRGRGAPPAALSSSSAAASSQTTHRAPPSGGSTRGVDDQSSPVSLDPPPPQPVAFFAWDVPYSLGPSSAFFALRASPEARELLRVWWSVDPGGDGGAWAAALSGSAPESVPAGNPSLTSEPQDHTQCTLPRRGAPHLSAHC